MIMDLILLYANKLTEIFNFKDKEIPCLRCFFQESNISDDFFLVKEYDFRKNDCASCQLQEPPMIHYILEYY